MTISEHQKLEHMTFNDIVEGIQQLKALGAKKITIGQVSVEFATAPETQVVEVEDAPPPQNLTPEELKKQRDEVLYWSAG